MKPRRWIYFTWVDPSKRRSNDDSQNLLGINAFERSKGHKQGSLSVSESDPDEFAAGLQDNGVVHGDIHADPVITKIDGGDGGETSFLPKNHKVISFSSTGGCCCFRFLSTDGGTTFIQFGCDIGGEKNSTVLIDPTPDLVVPKVFTYNSDEAGTISQVLSQDLSDNRCLSATGLRSRE